MLITWHGLSCVRVQTRETTLLIDPFPPTAGLHAPRLQADLFLFSSPENPQRGKISGPQDSIIAHPGEFEYRGIFITGFPLEQPSGKTTETITLFSIESDGVILGHLGNLARPLTEDQLDGLKNIDVLLIPVGGKPVLNAQQATEVISQIEPRVVLPIYYKIPGLTIPLESPEKFGKEMGVKSMETLPKIRLSRKDLPEEDTQVYFLKP